MEAKYLKEQEKVVAVERLRANQQGVTSRQWRWDHVLEVALDVKTYLWFFLIITTSITSGGKMAFGNLIIKSFGYSSFAAILFNIAFGVIQIVAIIGSAAIATKWKCKGFAIAGASVFPIIGTIILLTVPRRLKDVLLFGYYLVSVLACITPLIYTWHIQNTAGDTKRKTTSGIVFVGMCAGNAVGAQLYSTDQVPEYRPGLISNLIMYLSKRHASQRAAVGKLANKIDESMVGKDNVAQANTAELEEGAASQGAVELDKGSADVTDLKNEDFIDVY